MKTIFVLATTLLAHCASADHDLVFPVAHYTPPDPNNGGEYENPYGGLLAQSIDASGDTTTYHVWSTCKPGEDCWGRQPTSMPMPTYTATIGTNSTLPYVASISHFNTPY